MNAEIWWKRRAGCAREMLAASFRRGMGPIGEPRLAGAVGDLLARPGSLVRAVVAYLLSIEMGLAEESARALGCGLEYLHTASLVFDDLPAMDDARTRRGAACLHVVHGEAMALLAALALINRGYFLLWQGMRSVSLARRDEASELVDECLGINGLAGGQAYDLGGWRGRQDPAEVAAVAARKTGALLRLTVGLPALCGRATHREIQLLDRLALLRGLAYQAADDLKDVHSHESVSGKSAGRDEELGRPNLVAAEGSEAAFKRFTRLQETGDRVEAALPGPVERWGMLRPLRVAPPASGQELSMASAAV
ncbi:polyprenyl synthetase family protein [Luteolibacter arcticus]|uniref:Polyprenyl synthetase family protein n=1 Tax=Luteolibacter arcticus TaxID=1581411 RepID=A0ABT3GIP8_9BACT|nr:polyprenyl synthetase family protein [Luteolibacter arcticus]MCW1923383.1 polyprenyl synthetase family protein [Luteolibacter arcticus]